jgi:GntR family transcriptional regulator, transcriptional repressor for pyruvate dehydrogenase complex
MVLPITISVFILDTGFTMSRSLPSQGKLSDLITKELETMMIEGLLKPGDRLPPERELAERFDVSRPSLREAIQNLKAKGMVVSRQGGGNYISDDLGSELRDPLLQAMSTHPEFRYDLLEFRDAMEGISTYYAAIRSTDEDKEKLTKAYNELINANQEKNPALEAKLDAAFHLTIAECAHNAVMLHTMRALFQMLAQSIAANLDYLFQHAEARGKVMEQHTAIYQAIMESDPQAAKNAIHSHLSYVEDILLEVSRLESRRQRALKQANLLR